jgi:hypothetical protein
MSLQNLMGDPAERPMDIFTRHHLWHV